MGRPDSETSRLGLFLGAGLIAFVLGAVWFIKGIQDFQAPAGMSPSLDTAATVLSEPMALPEFHLTDSKGAPFSNQALQNTWSFLFFGYTYCPDICPTTLATLAETESRLQETSPGIKRQYVFISVDPARDTLDHLGEYVAYFNPQFKGVTGQEQEIQALAKPLGIGYQRSPEKRPEGEYLIDHSATILLIDPQARLRALISPPLDAAVIAQDFQKITASASP